MTVAVAWVRKVKNCEELVFASDSRLCGGHRWDECPKLMMLPGNCAVMAFAGDTGYAYPLMMQINYAMAEYERIRSRAMNLSDINGHVLNHLNHLIQSVYNSVDPDGMNDNEFLLGGYSWVEKRFIIWRYYYVKSCSAFQKTKAEKHILHSVSGNIMVIGDKKEELKREIRRLLNEKEPQSTHLDMEPFQALCNLLKNAHSSDTIGGAPQIIKAYQYMNTRPVGVYWPYKGKDDFENRTLLGRKLFEYEDTDFWFIDPKSMQVNSCLKNKQDKLS